MKKKYISLWITLLLTSLESQVTSQEEIIENYIFYHIEKNNSEAALGFLKNFISVNPGKGWFIMGNLFLSGIGLERNIEKANECFFKSSSLGFIPAFNALGDSYLSGDGIVKDTKMALFYYKYAAKRGYGPSQFNAGCLFKNGDENLPRNLKEGFYWLDKASKNTALGDLRKDAENLRDTITLPR